MSKLNLQDTCLSIGEHVDSPGFEEIREDLMRFLLQKISRDTEMELSDGEIADVDIVGGFETQSSDDRRGFYRQQSLGQVASRLKES